MIAMVLGLFLMGGVIVVFIGSSQSFGHNEALSRVQENGRFALEIVAQELRNAGFKGSCFTDAQYIIDVADPQYVAAQAAYDLNDSVRGWDAAAGEFFAGSLVNYQANTDLLLVKHAANPSAATLSADLDVTAAAFPVNGGAAPGTIMVISDAGGCNFFQNTAALNAGSLQRGTAGQTINNQTVAAQPLTRRFKSDGSTIITLFSSTLFYVGSSDLGGANTTALRRLSYDNGAPVDQELVEGVDNLTVSYATVSGAGPALNYANTAAQITAANNWDNVVAVRVVVNVQGEQNISHQFSTTVALRNRLR
ncbi:PilW family protein [Amphritea spongicola]|nr:PilW family protein [Aliamphritea spongicola]